MTEKITPDGRAYIQTQGLSKKYHQVLAVDQVDFHIRQGDIYGLIGKNGAGKTTLFKLLLGLTMATSGKISLFGETTREGKRKALKQIGSFIGTGFFPYLSAGENLQYYCITKGIKDPKKEIQRLLDVVGLQDNKKPFSAFSMGMKQRLGLAGALIGAPKMILLDEPVNGLDPEGIKEIRTIITQLNQQEGITFVISSHILSELEMMATTFGFLDKGKLIKEVTSQQVHQHTEGILMMVSDIDLAKKILNETMNIPFEKMITNKEKELILQEVQIPTNLIAKTLIEGQVDLFALQPMSHTLEEFFFNLIERD
ncbi:MAG: ATP-binding cassette domain-containing protein [Clostridiales bacterium]|nr:ATP-binding cassette domain-containing protein [Clostridiales bacterium]